MKLILAVVALDKTQVGGGAPIFFAHDEEEQHEVALLIAKVLGAAVHDLQNGVLVVVQH
ncbi:MAG TPA: hypothetical protein GX014_04560 [Firmicutes bacterium]|jgi:hypothetical protein|nr:hypothetical protein [Bacillota bacterium]HHT42655.1 hypothetical protein [Bacillota bacterium]